MSFVDIRKEIIRVLNGQSSRFDCGMDKTAFGLRVRKPPSAPTVILPAGPIVTENYLREQCRDILLLPKRYVKHQHHSSSNYDHNHQLDTLLFSKRYPSLLSASTDHIETDLEMKTFITGDAYKKELSLTDDYEDNKFESDDDSPSKFDKKSSPQNTSDISSNSNDCMVYSDSRDASDDIKPATQKASRKRGQKRVSKVATDASDIVHDICDDNSSDDNSSRSTLDLIIPPPKDFHGFNNPFVNESAKQSSTTDVTPKPAATTTTTSANPKTASNVPPLTLFGNTNFTPANNQIRFVNIVKRRLCEEDIMIGPNQEVKRKKYKRRLGTGPVEVCERHNDILNRTTKTPASNNCLLLHLQVISTTPIHAFSKSSSYLPIRTDLKDLSLANMRLQTSKESSSSSSTSTSQATTPTEQLPSLAINVHGRRLRKRDKTSYSNKLPRRLSTSNNCAATAPSSTNVSIASTSNGAPTHGSDVMNGISDLHSSLNTFFGAANRIAAREKAIVRGKRICANGRVEYLIEWGDCVS